jgi:hypothetical protein
MCVMLAVCACVSILYTSSVGDVDEQVEGENECTEESVDAPFCRFDAQR